MRRGKDTSPMTNSSKTPTKQVPQDLGAEGAVLGSLLLERDIIIKIAPLLLPTDFLGERNKQVYEAIISLWERREPPDIVLIAAELKARGAAADWPYLIEIMGKTPTAAHAEYYAGVVKDRSIKRQLISAGGEIAALGYDGEKIAADLLSEASRKIFDVTTKADINRGYLSMEEISSEFLDRLDELQQGEERTGIPSGLSDLDDLTGGYQRGNLITIAARPGVGKTSAALGMAHHAAGKEKKSAIFSLEMSREELVQRMVSLETGVEGRLLRNPRYLNQDQWAKVSASIGRISGLPIFIDDTPGLSLDALIAKAHRLHSEYLLDMVVVDYIGLVQATARKDGNRVQEMSEITRRLKVLAKDLRLPVLACAQLSRKVEERGGHVPILSDLRESGSIEQDSDIVIFIHREEMYDKYSSKKGVADLHIAKHRGGPTGVVSVRFDSKTTRFTNLYRGAM
jgi:replicative DNA helicase